MRRATIIVAAVVLSMSIALPVFAGQPIPEFLDTFAAQSYGGNDGSMDFNGPWIELGETNGPASGFVWVWDHEYCGGGYCLTMGGTHNGAENHGAYRAIDLTGASFVKLSFHDGVRLLDDESDGEAVVQISSDGGDTWKTLDTVDLDREDGQVSFHKKYTITNFASRDTVIRFMITEAEDLNAYWVIDNVAVEATFDTPPTSTTTTSTTEPTVSTTTTSTTEPTVSTTTTSTTEPTVSTTTTSTTKPAETTTTTHPREKEKKNPIGIKAPDETTTTTSRPETSTTTSRVMTTTTEAPAQPGDTVPPADREAMMSKTALAVPAASGTNAMPASMSGDSISQGHHVEPVEAFAAAFLTESGNYGGNLLPSVLLGIVIAVVSLIGLGSRRES
jgi:hypothetical protein